LLAEDPEDAGPLGGVLQDIDVSPQARTSAQVKATLESSVLRRPREGFGPYLGKLEMTTSTLPTSRHHSLNDSRASRKCGGATEKTPRVMK